MIPLRKEAVPDETPMVSPGPTLVGGGNVDIGRLFDEHGTYLLRVLHRLTGSAESAEDLGQEVFFTAYRRRDRLQSEKNIRTWLYRVAVNHVRHHRRSHARWFAFLGRYKPYRELRPTPRLDEDLARVQRAEFIQECVTELPPKQREVFVLYELEELEGREIARILDIPVNTVWSRLRLARTRFRKVWDRRYGTEDP